MGSEEPPSEGTNENPVSSSLMQVDTTTTTTTNNVPNNGGTGVVLNGSGLATPTKSEKGLPKAMVKPNILTHVIEGYVIQEANEPFPVTRQRYSEIDEDEPPSKFFAFKSFF